MNSDTDYKIALNDCFMKRPDCTYQIRSRLFRFNRLLEPTSEVGCSRFNRLPGPTSEVGFRTDYHIAQPYFQAASDFEVKETFPSIRTRLSNSLTAALPIFRTSYPISPFWVPSTHFFEWITIMIKKDMYIQDVLNFNGKFCQYVLHG